MNPAAYRCRGRGEAARIGVGTLGEGSFGRRGPAYSHGDVTSTCFREKTVEQFGAFGGVSEGGGDAENLELRASQREAYGESVVNVVADVGIDDDFLRRSRRGGWLLRFPSKGRAGGQEEETKTEATRELQMKRALAVRECLRRETMHAVKQFSVDRDLVLKPGANIRRGSTSRRGWQPTRQRKSQPNEC